MKVWTLSHKGHFNWIWLKFLFFFSCELHNHQTYFIICIPMTFFCNKQFHWLKKIKTLHLISKVSFSNWWAVKTCSDTHDAPEKTLKKHNFFGLDNMWMVHYWEIWSPTSLPVLRNTDICSLYSMCQTIFIFESLLITSEVSFLELARTVSTINAIGSI